MPVRRFRSVEEIPPAAPLRAGDPALFRAIGVTWDLARRTNPRRFPRGVERFRSHEDMTRLQDERDVEYSRQLHASRTRHN